MTSVKIAASRLGVIAASLAGLMIAGIAPASAQEAQPQLPQGWFKTCTKQADVDICNVQNIVTAETGQLIASVNLAEFKGKINRRVLQITVPPYRMLPPGVGLQIDDAQPQKLDYLICPPNPDRCIAEGALTDEMIAAFKKGSELTVIAINHQNQRNPIKVSLSGFTDAYDGEPLQQSDLEERRKQLQEYVNKNNDEFTQKLKEEQEKAKQAN